MHLSSITQTKTRSVHKVLYGEFLAYIENFIDQQATKKTNFKKGKTFEKVTEELGI